ncbi:hypothetical protein [uncultured Cetobacterium sp.]|uniref:hypothetical protein n=1 Tax=uncultured Cetobacterium sp. TaxID=527638 RepID=UPI00261BC3DF|nr:hypothetical protein [uncultured Cetobacterium sp.]
MKKYCIVFKYSKDGNSWVLTKTQIMADTSKKAIKKLISNYCFVKEIKLVEENE